MQQPPPYAYFPPTSGVRAYSPAAARPKPLLTAALRATQQAPEQAVKESAEGTHNDGDESRRQPEERGEGLLRIE